MNKTASLIEILLELKVEIVTRSSCAVAPLKWPMSFLLVVVSAGNI